MIATSSRPDRPLLVIIGIITALVIVALAVVFSRGEPAPLDASTPEGIVQRYAAAVLSGDEAQAALYLSPEAEDTCVAGNQSAPTDSMRIALASTTVRGDTADVVITMTTTYDGGLFGSSSYESDGTVSLVQADGSWRIMSVPWELTVCPMPEMTK
ncbi:nuclear transport factor 2 family protein [Cryobacterium sp. CG_9.6]|uniref:nuclear transport factor 2 family protein n=1 Tax=Cryobacterium sp. CG_9.6 TaxID=2760710 RepID=UPI0024746C56|nr:nuclear transport factor 2 family protein [Cryobacterium sp. CG_9.6]MDH6236007.1 hypothetical protein [Cryobacterium sp. CG_9.6]